MRNGAHVPAAQFVVVVESRVDEGVVHPRKERFQGLVAGFLPLVPAVEVGDEQGGLFRRHQEVSDGFGKLVAMRHGHRPDAEHVRDRLQLPLGQFCKVDIADFDQLAPRTVTAQELRHARHREDALARRAGTLEPELRKAEIVPDMRMRQEYPVEPQPAGGRRIGRREGVERVDLLGDRRRRFEQEALPVLPVDHAQRSRQQARRFVIGIAQLWPPASCPAPSTTSSSAHSCATAGCAAIARQAARAPLRIGSLTRSRDHAP